MKQPAISVIMATYNHAPFVVEAINSVLDQDFKDIEFLIADDGSKDATADAVDGYICLFIQTRSQSLVSHRTTATR